MCKLQYCNNWLVPVASIDPQKFGDVCYCCAGEQDKVVNVTTDQYLEFTELILFGPELFL